ncbi:GIY-YIG nuclease family protein [Pseudomonas sp. USHLN015]|uniref:GIY-YIG nuclease family protein n=1 Tax=Pseudomonas sp. USHLN015 TaxID=3081296 RepID=UPI00301B81D1
MATRQPAVYILASRFNGSLYIGVTSDLVKRIWMHRNSYVDGFTQGHGIKRLVHFEMHGSMLEAIQREKRLKKWRREWKVELIESTNPQWLDLWDELVSQGF